MIQSESLIDFKAPHERLAPIRPLDSECIHAVRRAQPKELVGSIVGSIVAGEIDFSHLLPATGLNMNADAHSTSIGRVAPQCDAKVKLLPSVSFRHRVADSLVLVCSKRMSVSPS